MNETVLVSGRDVVYRHLAGDEPTLVLVHGAGSNHAAFDDLTVHLGGRETIIPSLPGRCGSEGEPLASVAELAAWLRKLLRALGLRRVVLAGHSLGGAVAMEYAIEDGPGTPALAGLALLSTGARLRVAQGILDGARDAAEHDLPCELAAGAWERDPDLALVRRVEESRARTPARVACVDWMAADGFDRMGDLGRVRCPTVVIAGSEDRLTPEKYARYLAANVPGARLELLYGGSHMCVTERPADVARRLSDFVGGLPR